MKASGRTQVYKNEPPRAKDMLSEGVFGHPSI